MKLHDLITKASESLANAPGSSEYGEMRQIIKSNRQGAIPIAPKTWDGHPVADHILGWIFTGCPWYERGGGCAVCDGYGKNADLDRESPNYQETLYKTIDDALEVIRQDAEAKLASGKREYKINLGSAATLNDKSMPSDARQRLFEGVNEILMPYINRELKATYLFETRLPDITEEKLQEIRRYIDPRIKVTIGVGYEASNEFVRETMLNKGYGKNPAEKLRKAVEMAKKYNITIEGHALLGIPGLTELESIASAVETTKELLESGVERAIIMTTNVKNAPCLASNLYREGRWQPVSMHATAETIRLLNEQGYSNFLVFGFAASDPTEAYAQGCEKCTSKLGEVFRTYSGLCTAEGPEAAAEYFRTADVSCECKTEWLAKIIQEAQMPALKDRMPEYVTGLRRKVKK